MSFLMVAMLVLAFWSSRSIPARPLYPEYTSFSCVRDFSALPIFPFCMFMRKSRASLLAFSMPSLKLNPHLMQMTFLDCWAVPQAGHTVLKFLPQDGQNTVLGPAWTMRPHSGQRIMVLSASEKFAAIFFLWQNSWRIWIAIFESTSFVRWAFMSSSMYFLVSWVEYSCSMVSMTGTRARLHLP